MLRACSVGSEVAEVQWSVCSMYGGRMRAIPPGLATAESHPSCSERWGGMRESRNTSAPTNNRK